MNFTEIIKLADIATPKKLKETLNNINNAIESLNIQINDKIDTLHANAFIIVDTLPLPSEEALGKIYLVPSEETEDNFYDEYITVIVDGAYKWEPIGNTKIEVPVADVKSPDGTSYVTDGVATIPIADLNKLGLVKWTGSIYGVWADKGELKTDRATKNIINNTQNDSGYNYRPIVPTNMHYALKVAISTMAQRPLINTQYTAEDLVLSEVEQESAQEWLGVKVRDGQINGQSVVTEDGVFNIPIAADKLGLVKSASTYGVGVGKDGTLNIYRAYAAHIKGLSNIRSVYCPITPINMHYAVKTAIATMLTRKDAVTPSGVSLDAEYSEVLLNDSEKAAAQEWLGITNLGIPNNVVKTPDEVPVPYRSVIGYNLGASTPRVFSMIATSAGANARGTIATYNDNGRLVSAEPTQAEEVATKNYVDNIPKLYKHVFRVNSSVDVSIFMTLCLTNSIETAMIATGDEIYEEDKLQELIGILNNLYSNTIPDINGYVENATATNVYPIVAANPVRARNNINIQYIGKSDVDDSQTVIIGVDLFASVIACTVEEEIIEIN